MGVVPLSEALWMSADRCMRYVELPQNGKFSGHALPNERAGECSVVFVC